MADGKVVIDVILNDGSVAKGIANIDGIGKSGERAGIGIGKMVTALGLVKVASAALGVVKNSLDGAISRFDTMQKFPKVMDALGFSTEQSKNAINKLSDGIDGLPTKLDDVVASTQQLTSITGDLDRSTDTVLALNNAFLASGASTDDASRGMQQFNQMLSSGTVDLESWKTLQETMPLSLQKTAEAMGFVGKSAQRDLYAALKEGTVTFDQFQDKLIELGTGTGQLAGLAKENSLGIATSFGNLKNAVAKNIANIITKVDEITKKMTGKTIAQNIDGLKVVINKSFESIINNMDKVIPVIEKVVKTFKTMFGFISEHKDIIISAIAGITGAMIALSAISKVSNAINLVKSSMMMLTSPIGIVLVSIGLLIAAFVYLWKTSDVFREKVTKAFETVKKAAENLNFDKLKDIGKITGVIAGILVAVKGLSVIKSFNPFGAFKKNTDDPLDGVTNKTKSSKNIITSIFKSISEIIKSTGNAIKISAIGIGKGISTAFKGIGAGLKTAGVKNILALGTSVGIAAVGIGAGIGIIVSSLTLLATQSKGVSEIIKSLGDAVSKIASTVISAFAKAIISVSTVLPTVTSALVQLSPLIVAIGEAFAAAAPFVAVLGATVVEVVSVIVEAMPAIIDAFSGLITSISDGISQIATAITPIIEILANSIVSIVEALAPYIPSITEMFTTIAQVVAQAVVDIITALAPFIPEITKIVEALAPVIQSIVDSFTNLVNQISPVINSFTKLLKTFGEQVSKILESAAKVVESFGTAITKVLDGVAKIFKSMGEAALNAGKGVKEMAQGIKILVDLKLGDLIATLASVAKGLKKISDNSEGIATVGAAIKNLGQGFLLIASSATTALASLTSISTNFSTLKNALGDLPTSMTTVATSFANFASQTLASALTLMLVNAPIASLKTQIVSIIPSLMLATVSITAFGNNTKSISSTVNILATSLNRVSSVVSQIRNKFLALTSSTLIVNNAFVIMTNQSQLNISKIVNIVRSGFQNIVKIIGASALEMASVFRNNSNQMIAAARSIINQTAIVIRNGRVSMYSAGSYMAQGLAEGMRSALSSVTAAANELVIQAERAAKAKADINSPSRLFRDQVGLFIGQGVAVGIEKSKKYVDNAISDIVLPNVNAESLLSKRVSGLGASNSVTNNNYYQANNNNALIEAISKISDRAIVVEQNMDSVTFSKVVAQPISNQLRFNETRNNRLEGIVNV